MLMERSPTFAAIATALAKAQAGFLPIEKNCTARIQSKSGASYTYDYADLSAIRDATVAALTANCIALVHAVETVSEDGSSRVRVQTELIHESGEFFRSPILEALVDSGDIKQVGIATTYFRRYQVQTLLGIAPEEDKDADGAGERKENFRSPPPAPSQQGARFTCSHGHKHTSADGAKNCKDGTPPPTEVKSEEEKNPAAQATALAELQALLDDKQWNPAIGAIGKLSGQARKDGQALYNAARQRAQ
jgi:hypothetical protein